MYASLANPSSSMHNMGTQEEGVAEVSLATFIHVMVDTRGQPNILRNETYEFEPPAEVQAEVIKTVREYPERTEVLVEVSRGMVTSP